MTIFKRLRAKHSLNRLKSDLLFCADSAILAAFFGSLSSLSPSDAYFIDLASQFQLQYFCAAVLGLLFAIILRRRVALLASLVCIASSGCYLVPYYSSTVKAPPGGTELRIVFGNVFTRNPEKTALVKQLRELQPDIAVLNEVDEEWVSAVSVLKDRLPHVYAVPRDDNFGIAIFSRFPLANIEELSDRRSATPTLIAEIQLENETVTLVAAHPLPPAYLLGTKLRNDQLDAIADFIRGKKGPRIIAGDLNTAPWAVTGKRFLRQSALHEARMGFGVLATWPSFAVPFAIPIDHILVSSDLSVRSCSRVDLPGSDHAGLLAVLVLQK